MFVKYHWPQDKLILGVPIFASYLLPKISVHIDTGTTIMPVSCNINAADKILKDYAGSCIL